MSWHGSREPTANHVDCGEVPGHLLPGNCRVGFVPGMVALLAKPPHVERPVVVVMMRLHDGAAVSHPARRAAVLAAFAADNDTILDRLLEQVVNVGVCHRAATIEVICAPVPHLRAVRAPRR